MGTARRSVRLGSFPVGPRRNAAGCVAFRHVLLVATLLGTSGVLGCATTRDAQARTGAMPMQSARPDEPTAPQAGAGDGVHRASPLEAEEWGIEVVGLTASAAGYLLDFRYRITDPEKASSFMDRQAKPYLVDEATGAKLFVPSPPKVGPLRQTTRQPRTDRTYAVLFANPGRFLAAGDRVTLVVGECRLENVIVQ